MIERIGDKQMTKLLNAIKPPPRGNGPELTDAIERLHIKTLPLAYQVDIDPGKDGVFSGSDRQKLRGWIRANVRRRYGGPACLDYEHPFWRELADTTTSPERLAQILNLYRKVLRAAKSGRRLVKWGFFGIPRKLNFTGQTEAWRQRVLSFSDLMRSSGAAFPSIYDSHVGDAGGQHLEAIRNFVSLCLEAACDIPVYLFVSGRYHRRTGLTGEARWIPDDEFCAHVNSGLEARWKDAINIEHRVAGIVLWDSYGGDPEETWPSMDQRHAHQVLLLHDLIGRVDLGA